MNKCPLCGSRLAASFAEHTEYPVSDITACGVDVDVGQGHCYDNSLIHIACYGCYAYWYSVGDFLQEMRKVEDQKNDSR